MCVCETADHKQVLPDSGDAYFVRYDRGVRVGHTCSGLRLPSAPSSRHLVKEA